MFFAQLTNSIVDIATKLNLIAPIAEQCKHQLDLLVSVFNTHAHKLLVA